MLMDPQPKSPSLHNSQTGTSDQKLAPRSRTLHPTCGQNRHWAVEVRGAQPRTQWETIAVIRSCIRSDRGVQYVHWVMHKCIMAKVGGNTRKVCKKLFNFWKTEGKFLKT